MKCHQIINCSTRTPRMALLILILLLATAAAAHATLFDYTYTGELLGYAPPGPFVPPIGYYFPAGPTYRITVDFTSGPLVASSAPIQPIPFTISDGVRIFTSGEPGVDVVAMYIGALDPSGLPSSWDIAVDSGEWELKTDSGIPEDYSFYEEPGPLNSAGLTFSSGSWAAVPVSAPAPGPVPEPATLLLVASGLGGLAATRKWKRS